MYILLIVTLTMTHEKVFDTKIACLIRKVYRAKSFVEQLTAKHQLDGKKARSELTTAQGVKR